MKSDNEALIGLFVVVVEDEILLAMMLEDMLKDLGCRVALAGTVGEAMTLIRGSAPDGFLLDMNVHGQKTLVLAEELDRRSVPFLLVTGYGPADDDPPVIKAAPRVQKPFSEEVLRQRMAEVFASGAA